MIRFLKPVTVIMMTMLGGYMTSTFRTCHQHKLSPISVNNIDITVESPLKAYMFTILILIGFCLGFDTPTNQKEDTENEENANVKARVLQYEEKIATTDGSKPLLEKLPNGSITGRNRFKTVES